jgi:Cu+-exporting ATPase
MMALKSYGDAVVVTDAISLSHPFIKFTYVPSPPQLTIRSILENIKRISEQFNITIVHPMSLEERSAKMAHREQIKLARRLLLTFLVAVPTFIVGIVGMSLVPSSNHFRMYLEEPMWAGDVSRAIWALFFLATPVYFFAADLFHVKAIKEVLSLWKGEVSWKRRLFRFGSMNLLMSLGTTIAYFASIVLLALSAQTSPGTTGFTSTYFDSVVFLTLFLLLGRFIDAYSKAQTASAVSLLGNLRPDSVHLVDPLDDSTMETVPFDMVEVGDYVKVLPGERCSVDAIVIQGTSLLDESTLTGESRPVVRSVGDQIFAGTVNCGSSAIIGRISAIEEGSLLSSIVSIVREGQLHRAPIERVAEKITGVFVPIVTLIAVLTWIIWLALGELGVLPQS